MSVITKDIEIAGDKGRRKIHTLFDSGATYSFIRKTIAEEIATLLKYPAPKVFTLGNKSQMEATHRTAFEIIIDGLTISDEVVVADELAEDFIIGASTMQKWRIKLDMEKEEVIIDPNVTELKLI
jgi:hypothetical protein